MNTFHRELGDIITRSLGARVISISELGEVRTSRTLGLSAESALPQWIDDLLTCADAESHRLVGASSSFPPLKISHSKPSKRHQDYPLELSTLHNNSSSNLEEQCLRPISSHPSPHLHKRQLALAMQPKIFLIATPRL